MDEQKVREMLAELTDIETNCENIELKVSNLTESNVSSDLTGFITGSLIEHTADLSKEVVRLSRMMTKLVEEFGPKEPQPDKISSRAVLFKFEDEFTNNALEEFLKRDKIPHTRHNKLGFVFENRGVFEYAIQDFRSYLTNDDCLRYLYESDEEDLREDEEGFQEKGIQHWVEIFTDNKGTLELSILVRKSDV